jgi:uncharacterized protein (DUF362 family)
VKKLLFLFFLVFNAFCFISCESSKDDDDEEIDGLTPSTVSLVRSNKTQASSLTYEDILELTRQAIDLAGGLDDIIKTGDVVVLKPNLITSIYSWSTGGTSIPMLVNGVCTDWRVIQATAQIVREIIGPYNSSTGKGKIMVIEGPGKSTNAAGSTEGQFNNVGYTPVNLTYVDQIIRLESEGSWSGAGNSSGSSAYVTAVRVANHSYTHAGTGSWYGSSSYATYFPDGTYYVNKKMYEADALISIPVLKQHTTSAVTGAIKNIGIGATPPRIYGISANEVGRNAMVNHSSEDLHKWIADYFTALPADFVVMDGLQGLESGPLTNATSASALSAYQKNMRCMLASKDALALDTVAANIMTWDHTTVPYLKLLSKRGLVGGKPNRRQIPLRGNPRDIIVFGNVKVDDVRTVFAGNMGTMPGTQIPAAKRVKPTITINSAEFDESDILNLELSLSTGDNNKVVKIDIYIDGKYITSFNTGMGSVSLDASGISSGSRNIEVLAFTKYMYSASATKTAVK